MMLSSKGIYCFDIDTEETYGDFYRKVSLPSKELCLSDLPKKIKNIITDHVINTDIALSDRIIVPHAY